MNPGLTHGATPSEEPSSRVRQCASIESCLWHRGEIPIERCFGRQSRAKERHFSIQNPFVSLRSFRSCPCFLFKFFFHSRSSCFKDEDSMPRVFRKSIGNDITRGSPFLEKKTLLVKIEGEQLRQHLPPTITKSYTKPGRSATFSTIRP